MTAAAMFAMAAIPGALSSDRARDWLLATTNKILAPSRLELASLRFSWFAPTSMTGLVLRDAKGEAVVRADEVEWNRRLGQIISGFPSLGTIELNHATINVERGTDGKIDLYEVLRPIMGRDPRIALKVVVNNGTLGFWSEELAEPIRAEHFDSTLEISPAPKPLSWKVKLANWRENQPLQILSSEGRIDQWRVKEGRPSDLEIAVSSQNWPCSIALSKMKGTASGKLDASISAVWKDDRLRLSGEALLGGLTVEGADLYGFKFGPTEIAIRAKEDVVSFDPIEVKLNSGLVHLEPDLILGEKGGPAIRLGRNSWVEGVEVNDEVSRRVLAFVAPVLGGASSVHGKVSTRISSAYVPLRKEAIREIKLTGTVQFQDVTFTAGSFAGALLDLAGQDRRIALRLDEPVALSIADARVRQSGLTLSLGNLSRVELDGWVDFNKKMEIDAKFSLPPALVASRPVLSAIVDGTKILVPIRGSLDQPELDLEAGRRGLVDLGATLLRQSVTKGLPSLFMKVIAPGLSTTTAPPNSRDLPKAMKREP